LYTITDMADVAIGQMRLENCDIHQIFSSTYAKRCHAIYIQ
jgi:hypothetical protein